MFHGSRSKHIGSRRGQPLHATTRKWKGCGLFPVRLFLAVTCAGIVILYVYYVRSIVNNAHAAINAATALPRNEQMSRQAKASHDQKQDLNHNPDDVSRSNSKKIYQDWRALAVDLAAKPADEILSVLETQDPFGVRRFEKHLLEAESARGAFLTSEQLQELFPCPVDRITLPDQRDRTKEKAFRDPSNQTYLFFQHLRKAGGTNFVPWHKIISLVRLWHPIFACPTWNGRARGSVLDVWTRTRMLKLTTICMPRAIASWAMNGMRSTRRDTLLWMPFLQRRFGNHWTEPCRNLDSSA
ncbi:hypothetical protein MHU86_20237 [Fragilaria crotonensis]|nr:hypothetical protein MHU86_20237 [Fragilaria crotonensis]